MPSSVLNIAVKNNISLDLLKKVIYARIDEIFNLKKIFPKKKIKNIKRIFIKPNSTEKFDPEGNFIKNFIPELKNFHRIFFFLFPAFQIFLLCLHRKDPVLLLLLVSIVASSGWFPKRFY